MVETNKFSSTGAGPLRAAGAGDGAAAVDVEAGAVSSTLKADTSTGVAASTAGADVTTISAVCGMKGEKSYLVEYQQQIQSWT
jgi:hypothetical protein